MKAFYRIVCGTAAVLISLGLLLSLIGFLMGGRPADLDEVVFPLHGSWRIGLFQGNRLRGNPLYGSDTIDIVYPGGITKLDFDLSCADVTIKTGENFKVEARKINAKRFSTEVDGDTWEMECDVNNMSGDKAPTITITVPKGFVAEEAELNLSMGTLAIKDLAAKESTLEVGMGEMIVDGFSSGDCELNIGMGNLELTGKITGQGQIQCGMGSAELTLTGDPADYGFAVTVGMGSVEVHGEEISQSMFIGIVFIVAGSLCSIIPGIIESKRGKT